MASIWKHSEDDWCHICGFRRKETADVFYPENAEHDKLNSQYVRVCASCADNILKAIREGKDVETTPWHKSSRKRSNGGGEMRFPKKQPAKIRELIAGSTLPKLTGSAVVMRLYKCPECGHEMKLKDQDVWGKIVICTNCAARVANNFDMFSPQ